VADTIHHADAVVTKDAARFAGRNVAVLNLKTCHLAQCDINTGAVIDRKMLRVTPPSTNSRKREWP